MRFPDRAQIQAWVDQKTALGELYEHYYNVLSESEGVNLEAGVVVVHEDREHYAAAVLAALSYPIPLFLENPKQPNIELSQFSPGIVIGACIDECLNPVPKVNLAGDIVLPTGGSTFPQKYVIHSRERLMNSVLATQEFLQVQHIDILNVLPVHHISGLMPLLRACLTGGTYSGMDLKQSEPPKDSGYVLSLVPTQLSRLLTSDVWTPFLSAAHTIFLGGAAAPEELLQLCRAKEIPVALTYGMSETGSMVAALPVQEFLQGASHVGYPLSHVQLTQLEGQRISICGESLFCGYYPEKVTVQEFVPQDQVLIQASGELNVLGRVDNIIISGGEKIDPGEIITHLLKLAEVTDVVVIGVPDGDWGQAVLACVECSAFNPQAWEAYLTETLPAYKIPKHWKWGIPRNELGKFDAQKASDLMGNL